MERTKRLLSGTFFMEWVGTEAFCGLAHTVAEPYLCLHSCNYYLTLTTLPAGYQFNLSRAQPWSGHSNFQGSMDFFPFLLTDGAIGKGDSTIWRSSLGELCVSPALFCCGLLRKRCMLRERQRLVLLRPAA